MRSDEEAQEMPDWVKELKPPTPITEEERQAFIRLEIKRQQGNYAAANPPQAREEQEGHD